MIPHQDLKNDDPKNVSPGKDVPENDVPEPPDLKSHPANNPKLEQYRSFLLLLARMHLSEELRARVDSSDVVQQTLLEAHAQANKLPTDASELAAWLRVALTNNIRDARKHWRRQRRDMARERSLDASIKGASEKLADRLAALGSSPSQQAVLQEDLLRMADALWKIPELQRDAIIFHHLQGWTLSETAKQLGKTEAAVAGLLHRGLRKLREMLSER